jgi:hypothetical protein
VPEAGQQGGHVGLRPARPQVKLVSHLQPFARRHTEPQHGLAESGDIETRSPIRHWLASCPSKKTMGSFYPMYGMQSNLPAKLGQRQPFFSLFPD